MTHQGWERLIRTIITGAFLWAALMLPRSLRADQIEMVNGDRYVGQVVSLGPETLVVQSEVLGTLKLPRSRIANINLSSASGARSTTNEVRLPRFSTVLPGSNSLAKASPAAQS